MPKGSGKKSWAEESEEAGKKFIKMSDKKELQRLQERSKALDAKEKEAKDLKAIIKELRGQLAARDKSDGRE